jgi:hypothetical protein
VVAEADLASQLPGVSYQWTSVLPLRGLFDLGENATRIFAVNGIDVTTKEEFDAAVRQTTELQDAPTVELVVTMGLTKDDAQSQTWTLPVAQIVSLDNGWTFETAPEADGWVTRVTSVPIFNVTDIEVGDIVYGYIPSAERMNERLSMVTMFEREIAAGTDIYNFAIKRGELAWVSAIEFDADAYANN